MLSIQYMLHTVVLKRPPLMIMVIAVFIWLNFDLYCCSSPQWNVQSHCYLEFSISNLLSSMLAIISSGRIEYFEMTNSQPTWTLTYLGKKVWWVQYFKAVGDCLCKLSCLTKVVFFMCWLHSLPYPFLHFELNCHRNPFALGLPKEMCFFEVFGKCKVIGSNLRLTTFPLRLNCSLSYAVQT